MSQLISKPEMAAELSKYLTQQAENGYQWVVYDVDNPISSQWELNCFPEENEALDFAREYQQIWNWHMAVPISELIYGLKKLKIQ